MLIECILCSTAWGYAKCRLYSAVFFFFFFSNVNILGEISFILHYKMRKQRIMSLENPPFPTDDESECVWQRATCIVEDMKLRHIYHHKRYPNLQEKKDIKSHWQANWFFSFQILMHSGKKRGRGKKLKNGGSFAFRDKKTDR